MYSSFTYTSKYNSLKAIKSELKCFCVILPLGPSGKKLVLKLISGRVDKAPAAKTVDSISISGRVLGFKINACPLA